MYIEHKHYIDKLYTKLYTQQLLHKSCMKIIYFHIKHIISIHSKYVIVIIVHVIVMNNYQYYPNLLSKWILIIVPIAMNHYFNSEKLTYC